MFKEATHFKIQQTLYGLIAVFLPLYINLVVPLALLVLLNRIIGNKFYTKFSLKNYKYELSSIVLYLCYVLGLLWTANFSYAFTDLEIKLSLLLFPLIILNDKFDLNKIVDFFLIGCLLACITALSLIVIQNKPTFLYSDFSYRLHPSYFSMYLTFAVAILFNKIDKKQSLFELPILAIYFLLSLFMISILLLSAKMGILIVFVLAVYLIIKMIIVHKKYMFGLAMFVLGLIITMIVYFKFPTTLERIQIAFKIVANMQDANGSAVETTAARIFVWDATTDVIKENMLIGTGTGDVKDALLKKYANKGYTGAYDNKLNSHNQFLQVFATLGIIPGILFLGIFIYGMYFSLKHKNTLMSYFLIIMFFNMLVESMLETQAGVLFFAYFFSMLNIKNA